MPQHVSLWLENCPINRICWRHYLVTNVTIEEREGEGI